MGLWLQWHQKYSLLSVDFISSSSGLVLCQKHDCSQLHYQCAQMSPVTSTEDRAISSLSSFRYFILKWPNYIEVTGSTRNPPFWTVKVDWEKGKKTDIPLTHRCSSVIRINKKWFKMSSIIHTHWTCNGTVTIMYSLSSIRNSRDSSLRLLLLAYK